MPLQIRRGTTSQRLSITPLVSELVYDTTTKLVYVGDGVTAGGIAIDQDSSPDFPLGDLSDIDLEDLAAGDVLRYDGTNWINSELLFSSLVGVNLNSPEVNQVLKFNGTNWSNQNEDSSLLTLAVEDLTNVEINNPEVNQVLKFNGTSWSNQNEDSSLLVTALNDLSDVEITSLATDQVLKYDGTNWINDNNSIVSLGDVEITDAVVNQFLKYDGANWVNSNTFDGDVTGSVFSDTSTLLVDGTNGQIVGDINARLGGNLNLNSFSINGTGEISITGGMTASNSSGKRVQLIVASTLSAVNISTVRSSETIPINEKIGQITFRYTDNTGTNDSAVIISRKEGITITSGTPDDDKIFKMDAATGNIGLGILPEANYKLSANGNIFVTGRAYADVVGSLFADDSTLIIDGTSGNIVNLSFAGEVGNVPTDAVTVDSWLEVSVNGVTKYIPLYS
jgi:hypothetical protein